MVFVAPGRASMGERCLSSGLNARIGVSLNCGPGICSYCLSGSVDLSYQRPNEF